MTKLEAVFGDELLGLPIDEREGRTASRDADWNLRASLGITHVQGIFLIRFILENIEDSVLQMDRVNQQAFAEKGAPVPGGRDRGALHGLLIKSGCASGSFREFDRISAPEKVPSPNREILDGGPVIEMDVLQELLGLLVERNRD